ncbi:MAG: SUMF1/EgtB/PvdO family nonheme iron enzyme [Anaerolineae bacterium]|nr:SUMF1/EgtB/PvdO family nonheme iron enzyme [Anaerolineae bacterium]
MPRVLPLLPGTLYNEPGIDTQGGSMPVQQVFISYKRDDSDDFVRWLAAGLRAAGVHTWVDVEDIDPGENWDVAVERGLDACDAMIAVLTPGAVKSRNVRDEWSFFLDEDKPVYPVMLQKCRVPYRLRRVQHIDFSRDPDGALADLLDALGAAAHHPPTEPDRLPFEPETVLVPAGPCVIGSTAAHVAALKDQHHNWDWPEKTEQPQHTVTLPDYRIGRYPVTVGEYRAFVEAGGYRERRWWTDAGWRVRGEENWTAPHYWDDKKWTGDDRLPVIGVSWYEAVAYCRWLAAQTGQPYRLPTEIEWEKAARGPDGRRYPWGDAWRNEVCTTQEAGIGHTTPVGRYSPAGDSPYGAADMAGSVWEWCTTGWRDTYEEAADDDLDGDARRVVRGGSWGDNQGDARAMSRYGLQAASRLSFNGFRVVYTPPDSA